MRIKPNWALTLFLIFLAAIAYSANPDWPTQNGEPVQCNFGFKSVATTTVTLDDVDAVALSTFLPAGTIGFELRAKTGGFVIGHADNIATGTSRVGRLIAEGETFTWNGLAGTFNGVIIANDTAATVIVDGAWGWYEQ